MDKKAEQRFRNLQSNGFGKNFEKLIIMACDWYSSSNIAYISKIDERFRVIKIKSCGKFEGQFTRKADPDFMGVLSTGQAICFEAKYTSSSKLKKDVVTEHQAEVLSKMDKLGALCGVCCGIEDRYFFVPWAVWSSMEKIYGRKYVTCRDIEKYSVNFKHGINFLNV